eukprot:TRINITY_DN3252_c0_g1_i1.p1 TRINITY_DN3252_c0_g1~~TRINITY_DN3252_c0_g1_i1.p1  ORF type:complete len:286 (+),score=18.70 TRINITY_DN3252_c0_g1_i1:112-969(+)
MRIRTVFTDHSLFGFDSGAAIHMNKVFRCCMADVTHVICVSHTCKENTVLRSRLYPGMVSAIPNALDCRLFTPNPANRTQGRVTIVIISRLAYRKGVDLMIGVIPPICAQFPDVHFIIGGDGPMRINLEEMRERHQLHDRVELRGNRSQVQVHEDLTEGDIFLNCSLTEAFCIAIAEAASCGLSVVSTNVGGIPEVLPPHMIRLAPATVPDLVAALADAIPVARVKPPSCEYHDEIEAMYTWEKVSIKTERVYDRIAETEPSTPIEALNRYIYELFLVCRLTLLW